MKRPFPRPASPDRMTGRARRRLPGRPVLRCCPVAICELAGTVQGGTTRTDGSHWYGHACPEHFPHLARLAEPGWIPLGPVYCLDLEDQDRISDEVTVWGESLEVLAVCPGRHVAVRYESGDDGRVDTDHQPCPGAWWFAVTEAAS